MAYVGINDTARSVAGVYIGVNGVVDVVTNLNLAREE